MCSSACRPHSAARKATVLESNRRQLALKIFRVNLHRLIQVFCHRSQGTWHQAAAQQIPSIPYCSQGPALQSRSGTLVQRPRWQGLDRAMHLQLPRELASLNSMRHSRRRQTLCLIGAFIITFVCVGSSDDISRPCWNSSWQVE